MVIFDEERFILARSTIKVLAALYDHKDKNIDRKYLILYTDLYHNTIYKTIKKLISCDLVKDDGVFIRLTEKGELIASKFNEAVNVFKAGKTDKSQH